MASQLNLEKLKKKLAKLFSKSSLFEPLHIVQREGKFHLLLQKKDGKVVRDYTAISKDGFSFEIAKKHIPLTLPVGLAHASIVEGYTYKGRNTLYFGDRSITTAYSSGGAEWKAGKKPVLMSAHPLEVGSAFARKNSILLTYFEKEILQGVTQYAIHIAFFDLNNPSTLLWKTEHPIWRQSKLWEGKTIKPIGTILHEEKLITYFHVKNEGMYGVVLSGFPFDPLALSKKKIQLNKHIMNPILSPQAENDWEAFNTFNPAAVLAGGQVHILYRAQGFDYISSVGYAMSRDGISIDKRLSEPVYQPKMDYETNKTGSVNPDLMSGGGYGGCEDPRVTLLGDRIYMTYVAFNGWSSIRLALTSISLDDFLNNRWNWTKPVLLSRPGVIDKSGCLLPEKIRGKYVFFHRIFPNILIDFVDDLNFDGENKWLKGEYAIKVRPDKWDSRKIGAGAPPIKTKDGWLLIYYGVDDRDASKYHIGAMLLDIKNPTKVLYRSDEPILGPSEEYETNGFKPGIAYPCGALVKGEDLLVYYGGADSVVCVATANLTTFLSELKSKKAVHLHSVSIKEVSY